MWYWTVTVKQCSMILTHRENTNLGNSYNSPHSSSWVIDCITMTTSSNGNIFRFTGPLCGEFTGPGEFPAQRPVTRSFDVCFDLRPNKWLSKQSWGWWFETLSWSLWRQCSVWNHFMAWGLHGEPWEVSAGHWSGKQLVWDNGGKLRIWWLYIAGFIQKIHQLSLASP